MPDKVPPGVTAALAQRSLVVPVPLATGALEPLEPRWPGQARADGRRVLRLLWIGRFEHDKGGDGLVQTLDCLEAAGLEYELAVTGPQFRRSPPAFDRVRDDFSHRLVHFGYLEDEGEYRGLLAGADMVLSTALHEFQGIGVLEAVAQGCLPVVPDRLAYREIYPPGFRYPSSPGNVAREARAAADLIVDLEGKLARGGVESPNVSAFGMSSLAPRYSEVFERCAAEQDGQ
jgi:glycosyltransferase involved in cell wall biosynthesis